MLKGVTNYFLKGPLTRFPQEPAVGPTALRAPAGLVLISPVPNCEGSFDKLRTGTRAPAGKAGTKGVRAFLAKRPLMATR
jgi:hypothetical protein